MTMRKMRLNLFKIGKFIKKKLSSQAWWCTYNCSPQAEAEVRECKVILGKTLSQKKVVVVVVVLKKRIRSQWQSIYLPHMHKALGSLVSNTKILH